MTDHQKIIGILRQHIYDRPPGVPYTLNLSAIAEDIEEALQPSFSDLQIRSNEAEFSCRTCKRTCRIYRRNWRKENVQVLRLFQDHGSMTTAQVGKLFPGQTARKVPSELVDFALLRVCGTRGGDRLYRLTDAGEAFLKGREAVPEYVWPEGAPKECQNGPERFIHEMEATFPVQDRQAHVEASAAIT